MSLHPVAALVLQAARSHIGEMESPPYSNHHPTVDWYNKYVEYLAPAWNYCAGGVTREFWETPAKSLLVPGRAYVPWLAGDFEDGKNGQLIWIDSQADLIKYGRPGDIPFFDWEATKRHSRWVFDHVGVLEAVNADYDGVTIEHNTSVPGRDNQGTTRRVRDAKYIGALGRPDWDRIQRVMLPRIPGTSLLLLDIDGSAGPKTFKALSTIMNLRGNKEVPITTYPTKALTRAIQTDLNKAGKRDADGHALRVDGLGFGSNVGTRYPKTGSTHTIEAMQIGQGVARSRADGVLDADDSATIRRLQRDINYGGVNDSPVRIN